MTMHQPKSLPTTLLIWSTANNSRFIASPSPADARIQGIEGGVEATARNGPVSVRRQVSAEEVLVSLVQRRGAQVVDREVGVSAFHPLLLRRDHLGEKGPGIRVSRLFFDHTVPGIQLGIE